MRYQKGFTIVELLIVVVVIAILAAITIVSYNGISRHAKETALKSDLRNGATQIETTKALEGAYPATADSLKKSDNTTFTYIRSDDTFCLGATNSTLEDVSYHITNAGSIEDGPCPGSTFSPGGHLQTVTSANCPVERTLAVDARDNHTYWIQKFSNGSCWMLTNLAYAGGGASTYSDAKTLYDGTGDSVVNLTTPRYYVSANANPTTAPTTPSTSTDGGSTAPQYGYHYNWCGAMGGQTATAACTNAATPIPDPAISVCPAGWRLPTGSSASELVGLNATANGNAADSDAGLRTNWLLQRGGFWRTSINSTGSQARYWSSTPYSSTGAYMLVATPGWVSADGYANFPGGEFAGFSVRCIAN